MTDLMRQSESESVQVAATFKSCSVNANIPQVAAQKGFRAYNASQILHWNDVQTQIGLSNHFNVNR
jgi:hypothetical protein